MQIDVALIWTIEIFLNNIIGIIMRDIFVFMMITTMRSWRHMWHDLGIPRPKNHDIEIPRPKNRGIEIRGLKHHDIEKRRQISQDKKPQHQDFQTKKPPHRDSKTKKLWHQVPVEFWPLFHLIAYDGSVAQIGNTTVVR